MTSSAEQGLRKIESQQNARVKELRASLQRGIKTDRSRIAIEGEHLLQEAMLSGLRIRTIFVRSGSEKLLPARIPDNADVLRLSPKVFQSAVSTEHPQGIAAIVDAPEFQFEQTLRGTPLLIIAGALQDPGNLGALVRSAEAFGATGFILLPGTVSLWNGKTLRASSGSAFRLPVLAMTADEAFATLRAKSVPVFAAVARGGDTQADFSGPTALLLGNEGAGLPEDWLSKLDRRITIPCLGAVESLNAAVAGSVLLYEAARQRRVHTPGSGSKGETA
jgi:RNA methyltransferase, TrmH family